MNSPAYLKPGSTIAIAASARKVNFAEIADAIALLESWSLKVVLSETIYAVEHQFAGSDAERTRGLQRLLDDPSIDAILFARGGYGSVRIIDALNFNKFLQNPKWLIGFSDITVFLAHLAAKYQIPTIHACMAFSMQPERYDSASVESLKNALFGKGIAFEVSQHVLNTNLPTEPFSGELIGGNLSVLYALIGSESLPNTTDKILFLEDLDEYLYHIDRMLIGLKRAHFFKGLKAVLVGSMSDMKDNVIPFGKSANEIILDVLDEYQIPVVFGLPCGHEKMNKCLVMGHTITVTNSPTKISCTQIGA
jgi:muramoyltetrapeptide carboxypeptidase